MFTIFWLSVATELILQAILRFLEVLLRKTVFKESYEDAFEKDWKVHVVVVFVCSF